MDPPAAESAEATTLIQVPEYFYAVDINYLTHMIGKKKKKNKMMLN